MDIDPASTVANGWPKAAGRALAVRFGAMGDMVMFTAVLRRLALHHGGPVDVLTRPGASAQVLAGCPAVGRVLTVAHRRSLWWLSSDLRRSVRRAAASGYRRAYVFEPVTGLEARLQRSGCEVLRTIPSASWRGIHAIDSQHRALDLAGVGSDADCSDPMLTVPEPDRAAAAALLARRGIAGPLLVVQAGSSRTMHPLHRWRQDRNLKAWPAASWAGLLVAASRQRPDLSFVFAGAPCESADIEDILRLLPGNVRRRSWNLADALPVGLLAGLLAQADGCISVDTGPAHLAAAIGCPLVVLFGPADHRECRPRGPGPVAVVAATAGCSPCHGTRLVRACRDNVCMRGITVAEVFAAWNSLCRQTMAV